MEKPGEALEVGGEECMAPHAAVYVVCPEAKGGGNGHQVEVRRFVSGK